MATDPAPQYQVLVAYTITGQVVDALDQPGWSYEDHLAWADNGKATVTMPLPGRDRASAPVRDTLRSIASGGVGLSLAIVETLEGLGSRCLFAGPIVSPPSWDAESVSIGVGSIGKAILDRRRVVNPDYLTRPNNPLADVTMRLQPEDRVRALVALCISGTGRALPINIGPQTGLEGPAVTYRGSELKSCYESVKAIVEADGGPDVMLVPQVTSDLTGVYWDLAVGTPLGGPNPDAVWDYPVVAVSGDSDDSQTGDTAYIVGDATSSSGSGGAAGAGSQARLIGIGRNDRAAIRPALEIVDRTSASETRQEQLDDLATSYAQQYQRPVESLELQTLSDVAPFYRRAWGLGDAGRFVFTGHPWLDDREISARIIGVKHDAATLTFSTAGVRI